MLRSMTGFGRYEDTIDGRHIIVEIKSVNHKYFEFSARITRGFGFLEDKLKTFVQSRISRGKVDMFVSIENLEDNDVEVHVNNSLASGYVKALRDMADNYHLDGNVTVEIISRFNDIFSVHKAPEDEDQIFNAVKAIADRAIDTFVSMRENEGQRLYKDIMNRAEKIVEIVKQIEVRSPETVNEYRNKLENKLKEILSDTSIDEQRILTEAAIFADKIAVDEETVRLRSHFKQLAALSESSEPVGRKMDFLVQEMNREANTIGSKASDKEIAYMVVDIKAEIEKIREQIQNIE